MCWAKVIIFDNRNHTYQSNLFPLDHLWHVRYLCRWHETSAATAEKTKQNLAAVYDRFELFAFISLRQIIDLQLLSCRHGSQAKLFVHLSSKSVMRWIWFILGYYHALCVQINGMNVEHWIQFMPCGLYGSRVLQAHFLRAKKKKDRAKRENVYFLYRLPWNVV